MGIYGKRCEQCYRQTAGRTFDWLGLFLGSPAPAGLGAFVEVGLVVHYLPNGSHRLYFSTDVKMVGTDVLDIYRSRFQIEFCYRDGHQFTGLLDCQSRGEKALDFAQNASLAAVNITKVMAKEMELPLSIGRLKSLMVNAHFAKDFLMGVRLTLT